MNTGTPKILGFVVNMMFTTRIETVAEACGYRVQWVESLSDWKNPQIDSSAATGPALILVDLGIPEISWASWIKQPKTNLTTGKIPVVSLMVGIKPNTNSNSVKTGIPPSRFHWMQVRNTVIAIG